ncbi:hypothetical protein GCM10027563_18130 [Parasphingorhabdus pacifica]
MCRVKAANSTDVTPGLSLPVTVISTVLGFDVLTTDGSPSTWRSYGAQMCEKPWRTGLPACQGSSLS